MARLGRGFPIQPLVWRAEVIAAPVQVQRESSFENLTSEWSTSGPGTLTFPTVGDAPDGTHVARLTATGSGNPYFHATDSTLLIPISAEQIGQYLTAYAEYRWVGPNTPNSTTRFNVIFLDSSFATVESRIGTPFAPSTSWTRTQNNDNPIPATTAWAELRPIINNAVLNDSIEVDELYATIGSNIGDAGPHPPWTPHSADIAPPNNGSATGTWTFTGAATGERRARGTGTGTFTFTGTAAGERRARGVAAGAFTFAGAAVGKRRPRGSASRTWTFTGAAVGKRQPRGSATGTWTFAGAAVGRRRPEANAVGTFTFTGAASAVNEKHGTASGTFTFTGEAIGDAPGSLPYHQEVLADSPLLYVRLGEASGTTMVDSSGNSRNGTYTNPPVFGQASLTTNTSAKSADFVPIDYGTVADAAWMDTSTFAIDGLIRPDALGSYQALFTRDGVAGARGWNLYVLDSKLHVYDWVAAGGSVLTGATTLTNNTVYHIGLIYNGTTVRLYLNGVQDGSATITLTNSLANPLMVGASQAGGSGGPSFGFNGRMQEFAFYGTLSPTRMAAHSDAAFAEVMPAGSATGTFVYTGAASGRKPSSGAASGIWAFNGDADGSTERSGVATGTFAYTGTAAGERRARGSAAGAFTYTGSAVGKRRPRGSASRTWTFTGTATGKRRPRGSASRTWTFTGAASGERRARGVGTGIFLFTGAASGERRARGVGVGTWTFAATGSGSRDPEGDASGLTTWVGVAIGRAPVVGVNSGVGFGTWAWVGVAVAVNEKSGSATGVLVWTGTAVGSTTRTGTGSGTTAWVGAASSGGGLRHGSASGGTVWEGMAEGSRLPAATASGTTAWVGVASSLSERHGSAIGIVVWVGIGQGQQTIGIYVVGPPLPLRYDAGDDLESGIEVGSPSGRHLVAAGARSPRYRSSV